VPIGTSTWWALPRALQGLWLVQILQSNGRDYGSTTRECKEQTDGQAGSIRANRKDTGGSRKARSAHRSRQCRTSDCKEPGMTIASVRQPDDNARPRIRRGNLLSGRDARLAPARQRYYNGFMNTVWIDFFERSAPASGACLNGQ